LAKKILYQTLEDRGNIDAVERDGPFSCKWENTWLGNGYYFWDTFIDNAHWWGNSRLKYNGKYIICQAECDFDDEKCFDLVGSTEHLSVFSDAIEVMKNQNLIKPNTTVARVIEYIKNTLKVFRYDAIRVYGIKSKSENTEFSYNLIFEVRKPQYLDIKPAYQICIYNKNGLNLRNYIVIYPDEYNKDYLV
jgi:hypothetical protein